MPAPLSFALKNIVHQCDWSAEIADEIGDALTARLRYDGFVNGQRRVENDSVQSLIQLQHSPVPGLKRIIDLLKRPHGFGVRRWGLRGAGAKRQSCRNGKGEAIKKA